MKFIFLIFSMLFSVYLKATPQDSERLIYKNDTMGMDYYPLEVLRWRNKALSRKFEKLFPVMITTCWRGYHGTWKIVNDSLFLVRISGGMDYNGTAEETNLGLLFSQKEVTNHGVFAYWYSEGIQANCGDFLDASYDTGLWNGGSVFFSGQFSCTIKRGIVSEIKIRRKPQAEIDKILKARLVREDTMAYLLAEKMPVFKFDTKMYKDQNDFIQKNIRYQNSKKKYNGTVFVTFVVEKNGTISHLSIIRGHSPELDQEALSVIALMKDWWPGKHGGKVVRVRYMLPVEFKSK